MLKTTDFPSVDTPKGREKHRFMRYMTCALAMCSKRYGSDEVNTLVLEYGEDEEATKYCNQLIDEKVSSGEWPPIPGSGEICGSSYPLNFTWKSSDTYIGDYDVSWETMGGTPCGPAKMGLQTDVSCYIDWERFMVCSCLRCPTPPGCIPGFHYNTCFPGYPVGRLAKKTGECSYSVGTFGSIYVNENLIISGKVDCDPGNVGITDGLAECTFKSGTEIDIWADNAGGTLNYCSDTLNWKTCGGPPLGFCDEGEGIGCDCQKIVICES